MELLRRLTLTRSITPAQKKNLCVLVALSIFLVLLAKLFSQGSKASIAEAFIVGFSPLAIYIGLRRPLLCPYAVYAFFVPIDNVIDLGGLGNLTKLLGSASGFMLIAWLLMTKSALKPPRALIAWGALTIWVTASGAWALDSDLWWPIYVTMIQLFILYALVSLVPADEVDVRGVLLAVAMGGVAAASYALYDFSFGGDFTSNRLFIATTRNGEGYVDPNHFAASLLLPFGLVTMAMLRTNRGLMKLLLLIPVATLTGAFFVLSSRGAFIGLTIMLVYYFWMSPYRKQLLMLPLVALPGLIPVATNLGARLQIAISSGGEGRTSVWAVGLEAFKHHWLAGVGLGNFTTAYQNFYVATVQQTFQGSSMGSHSLIIGTGVELGAVGLLLTLIAWYTQFRTLSHISSSHRLHDLRVALEGATLGLFAASLFLDLMIFKYTWVLFTMLALVHSHAAGASSVAPGMIWPDQTKKRYSSAPAV